MIDVYICPFGNVVFKAPFDFSRHGGMHNGDDFESVG